MSAHTMTPARELDPLSFSLHTVHWPAPLSAAAERQVAVRITQGDRAARQELFHHNMRLVFFIASRYQNAGLDWDDLLQYGAIGLWHATGIFDIERHTRFSTHATWWIRQALTRGLANDVRLIRVPAHVGQRLAQQSAHPQDPALGQPLPDDPILQAARAASSPWTSLDTPLAGADSDLTLGAILTDEEALPPDSAVLTHEQQVLVQTALQSLPPRTQQILWHYFGWETGAPATLKAVAQRMNLTSERIRQIVQEALAQLRIDPALQALWQTRG